LVADGNTNEVLCWEEDPDHQAAHRYGPEDNHLGYANIYVDPELGATEVNLYGSYWRHNQARYRRANELLVERSGELDALGIAEILGDRGDPRCRVSDSIAMVMTVGSVVFNPADGVVWVGTGEAPTSRGAYLPFSFENEDWAGNLGELVVGADEPATERDAFEHFRQAYVAYLDDFDLPRARSAVEQACMAAPEQPLYHALRGLVALVQRDAVAAERAFDRALELGHPHEERLAAFHLWRGRARDVQGFRREAKSDFRAALGHHADAAVHKAARKGLRRRWEVPAAEKMQIDFAFADVIAP
jgi:tetratricopeptide (TPR) repeat protein